MINFTEEGLHAYLAEDDGGPVVMLNLLRFATNGGASKYSEYVRRIGASGINERYGVELIYGGSGTSALVAEAGQEWDLVALVRYPSRKSFVDMVRDPAYRAIEHLRSEALIDAVLQPTSPIPVV